MYLLAYATSVVPQITSNLIFYYKELLEANPKQRMSKKSKSNDEMVMKTSNKKKRKARQNPDKHQDENEETEQHQEASQSKQSTSEYDEDKEQFRKLTAKLIYLKGEMKRMKEEEAEADKQEEIEAAKEQDEIKNRRRNILRRFRLYEGRK